MKPGRLVVFLLLWLSAPALAQTGPAPAAATVRVVLHTGAGDIVVAVETGRAPVSARNFLRYVDQRRLDGAAFYRAMSVGPQDGLIQGGWHTNPRRMLPPIAHEPTSRTGLSHTDGAIAFARAAPGTATSEFYIVVGTLIGLDATATDPGYAVFGRVVEGMDVVRQILASPRSPTGGAGTGMAGQILAPTVRILTARRAR
ncbi:MAG TPA: peptidylprolyl isomerase [Allosphingosinicella sp.]|nr:peptidylprolyl isomerase [Allosphingosinicella sp.]